MLCRLIAIKACSPHTCLQTFFLLFSPQGVAILRIIMQHIFRYSFLVCRLLSIHRYLYLYGKCGTCFFCHRAHGNRIVYELR